ncbi:CoA-transferase subunit beta [Acuticoccus sp. M5D2P5]|uniref:CoA-transferase subunit beta n=1 Tax=Acuticoccus kalidii TaxID=2910977 RepID=UPI001F4043D4|nr:CoA-transferase [Acuticoccus kalidii]MCF3933401.1 CoA-transferase subunit beta [Acuticoccus kalidii]
MSATPTEMMAVAASRLLANDDVCFVGIGAPSAACNLARLTHAPDITLIYESGTIATRPDVLPLSIGDGELSDTALTTVSVPEMFRYWLQGGRVSIGFLGAAQLDARGNINTTVIGDYHKPKVRLPGGGGAPEIATQAREIFITARQARRAFVEQIDFVTSLGHGAPGETRATYNVDTAGPTRLITDLALWTMLDTEGRAAADAGFDARSAAFTVVSLHPGVTRDALVETVGWPVRFAEEVGRKVEETPEASAEELAVLRDLQARTKAAHLRANRVKDAAE